MVPGVSEIQQGRFIESPGDSPAASKLLAYIRANYGTIPRFCEEKGLSRLSVAKAVKGEIRQMTLELAYSIERATDGHVSAHEWLEDGTARAGGAQ